LGRVLTGSEIVKSARQEVYRAWGAMSIHSF